MCLGKSFAPRLKGKGPESESGWEMDHRGRREINPVDSKLNPFVLKSCKFEENFGLLLLLRFLRLRFTSPPLFGGGACNE